MVLGEDDDEAAPRAMSSPVAGSTAMSELDTLQGMWRYKVQQFGKTVGLFHQEAY
jgi:hypothetical protein